MKVQNKRAFTIVELVIVIAVIAILAAVLIPTFTSIIEKAEESRRLQQLVNKQKEDFIESMLGEESPSDSDADNMNSAASLSSETSIKGIDIKVVLEKTSFILEETEKIFFSYEVSIGDYVDHTVSGRYADMSLIDGNFSNTFISQKMISHNTTTSGLRGFDNYITYLKKRVEETTNADDLLFSDAASNELRISLDFYHNVEIATMFTYTITKNKDADGQYTGTHTVTFTAVKQETPTTPNQ